MKIKILSFFILVSVTCFAQGEGTLPFLYIQHSPLHRGAGDIGVSDLETTKSGYYYNPAKLGISSKENHISFFSIPHQDWVNSILEDLTYSNYGISFGQNLKNSKYRLPISIGIAFINQKLSYPEFRLSGSKSQKFTPYDRLNMLSLGIGYEYFFQINLGFSLKHISTVTTKHTVDDFVEKQKITTYAFDYGLLINTPISDLFSRSCIIKLDNKSYNTKF